MSESILQCPKCGRRGHIRTRLKTKDRVCAFCGYIGELHEFEFKINPVKPKKKK